LLIGNNERDTTHRDGRGICIVDRSNV
jgi:hypothetical protein